MKIYTACVPIYQKLPKSFEDFVRDVKYSDECIVTFFANQLAFQYQADDFTRVAIYIPTIALKNPETKELDYDGIKKFATKFNTMISMMVMGFGKGAKGFSLDLMDDQNNFPDSVYVLKATFVANDENLIEFIDGLYSVLNK